MKKSLPVIAAANWQAASRPNHLTREKFQAAYVTLEAKAPGQNLDRRIATKSSLVAKYRPSAGDSGTAVQDMSGNGYDAQLRDGVLHTPLGSKGHNYTVLISFGAEQTPGILLSGPDTAFGLTALDCGTSLAFFSDGFVYPLNNYTLPSSRSGSTMREIILHGTENSTSAYVDGTYAGAFVIALDGTPVVQPMAFVAPVQRIGTTGGTLGMFAVWDGLQDVSEITLA